MPLYSLNWTFPPWTVGFIVTWPLYTRVTEAGIWLHCHYMGVSVADIWLHCHCSWYLTSLPLHCDSSSLQGTGSEMAGVSRTPLHYNTLHYNRELAAELLLLTSIYKAASCCRLLSVNSTHWILPGHHRGGTQVWFHSLYGIRETIQPALDIPREQ